MKTRYSEVNTKSFQSGYAYLYYDIKETADAFYEIIDKVCTDINQIQLLYMPVSYKMQENI